MFDEADKEAVMKPATWVATIFLALISIAQFLRFVFQVEVRANGIIIPLWPSVVACIFTGALAALLWRENRRK